MKHLKSSSISNQNPREHSLKQTIVATFVVVSVFITNMLVFGFTAVLPIYLVEFKNAFPDSHNLVFLVIFLPSGLFGIVGFITGMFLSKSGVRITGILGSLLLTISVGAPSFSSSIYVLLGCFTILPGFGCSFLHLSASNGLTSYFGDESRKFIAFTTTGKAIGFIIFPILTNYFIEIMFWRGSLLLLAATFIQTLPCAVMYSTDMYKPTIAEEDLNTNRGTSDQQDLNKSSANLSEESFQDGNHFDDKTAPNKLEGSKKKSVLLNQEGDENTSYELFNEKINEVFQSDEESTYVTCSTLHQRSRTESSNFEEISIISSVKSDVKEVIDSENNKAVQTTEKSNPKFSARLTSVLTNCQFSSFLFTLCLLYGCVATSFTILPDYSVQQGLSRAESAKVFSIGSLGYALACLVGSWLVHKKIIPNRIIFSIAFIISGILICLYPLMSTATNLIILTFLIMFTTGIGFSLYFVTVLDYFDIDCFAIAIGFGETSIGLGILAGGYLIGIFSEYMGSYEYSYYVIGVGPIVSVQAILLPYLFKKLLNR